eukprot:5121316-Ditylum_brightwellii.AAC.1
MEPFLNNIDVIKHSDGSIGEHPKLALYLHQLEGTKDSMDGAVVNLSNAYLRRKDKYPKTLVGAHTLLTSWENHAASHTSLPNDGIAFTTNGYEEWFKTEEYEDALEEDNVALATDGEEVLLSRKGEKVICFNCRDNHYANKCPKKKKNEKNENAKGTSNVMFHENGSITSNINGWGEDEGTTGIIFYSEGVTCSYKDTLQLGRFKAGFKKCTDKILFAPKCDNKKGKSPNTPTMKMGTDHILHQSCGLINKNWVFLDIQLTVNVFCNAKLPRNICKADRALDIFSNASHLMTDFVGGLPGFKTVWCHPGVIANILSLSDVQTDYHVTFNNEHKNCFMVERKVGTVRKCVRSDQGLYYSVMEDDYYVLVNTVEQNKNKYSPYDYSCAVLLENYKEYLAIQV